ncbi:diadenylate cyclase [Paenibacillus sp. sgz500992]|uniref:diadenylate cyclase n=1 Tax=Paenibacillus sp. sgz500992 TaxID=3242476 RepID=UPI0036D3DE43
MEIPNETDAIDFVINLYNSLNHYISDFIGTDIEFYFEEQNEEEEEEEEEEEDSFSLGARLNFKSSMREFDEEIFDTLLRPIELTIGKIINEGELKAKLRLSIVEDSSMNLIFPTHDEETEDIKLRQLEFIEELNEISLKTYEAAPVSVGVFYCLNDKAFDELNEFDFEYIPIQNKKSLKLFIEGEKPLLKLIDNKSLSLVVNNEFQVVGFVKKIKDSKSIYEVIEAVYFSKSIPSILVASLKAYNALIEKSATQIYKEREMFEEPFTDDELSAVLGNVMRLFKYPDEELEKLIKTKKNKFENFIFIEINNREIQWLSQYNFVLSLENKRWKAKQYGLLFSLLFSFSSPQVLNILGMSIRDKSTLLSSFTERAKKSLYLFSLIRKLSRNNNGALFVILNNPKEKLGLNKREVRQLLKKPIFKLKTTEPEYKLILSGTHDQSKNIEEVDMHLLESIACIDGAVILDTNYNILSFGEMIQPAKKSKDSEIAFGARTNASINASYYGLAIKVSEDGDISVFKDGNIVLKI